MLSAHSRSSSASSLCEDPHQVDQQTPVLKVSLDVGEWLAAIVPDPVSEPVGECLLLHFNPLLPLGGDWCLLTLTTLDRVKHIRPAHRDTYVRTYTHTCNNSGSYSGHRVNNYLWAITIDTCRSRGGCNTRPEGRVKPPVEDYKRTTNDVLHSCSIHTTVAHLHMLCSVLYAPYHPHTPCIKHILFHLDLPVYMAQNTGLCTRVQTRNSEKGINP